MGAETKNTFISLVANIGSASARKETLEGIEHYVVPVSMMVEGVWNGSGGPVYYSEQLLSNAPSAWDHKPIVVYHPELQGHPVTASNPKILNQRKVGVLLNTRFEDGKLKSDAWIAIEKTKKVDKRIIEAIENGDPMEVSTGITANVKFEEGVWDDKPYIGEVVAQYPDHLAILPDKEGACNLDSGAGLLVNQRGETKSLEELRNIAHSDIVGSLRKQLGEKVNLGEEDFLYIEDFEDQKVIFGLNAKLFRIGFSVENEVVSLADEEPEEVERMSRFVPANPSEGDAITQNQKTNMDKKQLIDAILKVENSGLAQKDAEHLNSLPEETLKSMHDSLLANAQAKTDAEKRAVNAENQVTELANAKQKDASNKKAPEEGAKQPTFQELFNSAPDSVKEKFEYGSRLYNEARQGHVETITANEENPFSKEELDAMPFDQLERIAKLAKVANSKSKEVEYFNSFGGNRGSYIGQAPVQNNEPLEAYVAPPVLAPERKAS